MRSVIKIIVSQFMFGPLLLYLFWPLLRPFHIFAFDVPFPGERVECNTNSVFLKQHHADALTLTKQIVFFTIVEDALFYWSHRLLHTRWLYKRVHKAGQELLLHTIPMLRHRCTTSTTIQSPSQPSTPTFLSR